MGEIGNLPLSFKVGKTGPKSACFVLTKISSLPIFQHFRSAIAEFSEALRIIETQHKMLLNLELADHDEFGNDICPECGTPCYDHKDECRLKKILDEVKL